MPQYSSYFRNNIRRERIPDNTYSRNISVSLADYGTISNVNYVANANLFKKVYSDIINRVYDANVRVTINVPAGDYYFAGVNDLNQWTILSAPQFSNIRISGAALNGARPAATTLAAQTKSQNYTSLATYHTTRFHFDYNGFFTKGTPGGYYGISGFTGIGFFGSWGGAPGTQTNDSVMRRGLSGAFRLESCSIHGFDGNIYESVGILAEGNSGYADWFDLTICNCDRGILASGGGSAIGAYSSTDMVINYRAEGLLAFANSIIRVGDGSNIRSTISVGSYSGYAYDSSSIVTRNPSVSGGAGLYAYPDGSTIHVSTAY